MQFLSGYSAAFDAGHRYTVTVTWDREGWPDQSIDDFVATKKKIDALVYELADRDLTKMLGPHHPSAYGIATFFMERLSINVPVKRVEVHESSSDVRAIVEANAEF